MKGTARDESAVRRPSRDTDARASLTRASLARTSHRDLTMLVALACILVAVASILFAGSRANSSPLERLPLAAPSSFVALSSPNGARSSTDLENSAQNEPDFSSFSHTSQRHASLACASCHARAADNSTAPRLPGHKACTDCHLAQFVTPNVPLCSICHTTVEGENPPVKNFPALRSFNARFDHAQHDTGAARPQQGCAACHAPSARRAASLTIPASYGAHAECYTCHTPNAQANGRDIATCGVCHTTSARFFRTPTFTAAFRVGFSHATHGTRERLSCADCHTLRAGAAQSRQVTSTLPTEHFAATRAQSCATCHNSRRSFGETSFGDCRRCHKGQTFRAGV